MERPYVLLHGATEFRTKFSMPEVKYGYVAIKLYGYVQTHIKRSSISFIWRIMVAFPPA